MQIPYKAEFFDRSFIFQGMYLIAEPEIKIDYMTLDKTSVSISSLPDISRGWYCQITRGKNVDYQGVVSSVSQSENVTTVVLSPLQSLFKAQVYKKRSTYGKTNLEGWMSSILTDTFINSGDSVQDIFGLHISAATTTNGVALNLEDDIFDFWNDVAKKAMESAKIALFCSINPTAKSVNVTIKNMSSLPEVTLEADLPNVENQNFTIRDHYGSTNKCVIINSGNESEKKTFYSSDYSAPTVCRIEKVTVGSNESFSTVAQNRADEILTNTELDNLIELQYRVSDTLLPDIAIGQPCRIIKNGTVYRTVLTGTMMKDGLKTYIFGGIRIELTKILKLKGVI